MRRDIGTVFSMVALDPSLFRISGQRQKENRKDSCDQRGSLLHFDIKSEVHWYLR